MEILPIIDQHKTFSLETSDGGARVGTLHTPPGDVPTPAFMPVATQGSVKAIDPSDVANVGTNILLGNTYHLYLRPGVDLIEEFEQREGSRQRANYVRSFFIHNGVAMNPNILH